MRRQRGVSLLEVLVAVGIIAILLAILLPTIGKIRESAHRTKCAVNLRQISTALLAYATDNNGSLFTHRLSRAFPSNTLWISTTPASPPEQAYIPPNQRTCQPLASSDYVPSDPTQAFENEGGQAGLIVSLYPQYIPDGSVFVCPSVRNFAFSGIPSAYQTTTDFSDVRNKLPMGQSWGFWASYVGAVYSRIGSPTANYAHGFYDSYYIQGYYPYSEDYRSPQGALMWDVGSYAFSLGTYANYIPNANLGCHRVGGNYAYRDGSVSWLAYSWVPQ